MFNTIFLSAVILIFIYSPNYISFAQDDHDHDHDHEHEVEIDSTVQTIDTVKSVTEDVVQPKKSDETVKGDEIVRGVTVPAGTKFNISINTQLASNRNVAGSTFSATLADDILVDTTVVSYKNSQVIGKILESKSGQGIGDAKLSIQITEITVNKELTPVITEPITVKGGKKRNSEAEISAGTIEEVSLTKALIIK